MYLRIFPLVLFFAAVVLFPQEEGQTFLSLRDTGVEEFIKLYPEYDGRGVIILVLDTGVDIGIDGLTKTSTGDVKVIDVQDFTGQGDIPLYEAEISGSDGKDIFENEDMGYSVSADLKKMMKSADDNYRIGLLSESLLMNSNSGSADLNDNGTRDDKYYMVTYKTDQGYHVVYFDRNGNNDLSDEMPLRNYNENFDAFTIQNQKGLPPVTMALNIYPDENRISLFFDDGSHGTHCAGIAAGYNIGEAGINGVAPGAKVIGCKLGHNNYPGGATVTESMKKAYLYADKISRETNTPCIVSMSFGIGSEIEASSEMEKFLEELLKNNPYLYVSTSNGNEGPGISTAGLPSASSYVFTSGAVLTKEIARDNYGNILPNNMLLHFSSRGGEVSKPDVIAPGAATSTVPNFTGGDKFWGTSMACPYTSGVMALLLSAAQKEFPGVKIPSQLLYKVIREGAVKMDNLNVLDQGAGYVNVMNSYEILKRYLKNNEVAKFESYSVRSFAPNQPDNQSRNLYIRDASYLTGEEVFSFTIKRDNTIKSEKFYRVYNLKSDAEWLIPVQKKTYIRNSQSAFVNVKIDKSKLTEPGLYTAVISAYRDDAASAEVSALREGGKILEFDMTVSVVIPYEFNPDNNYKLIRKDQVVEPGMVKRHFLQIPAGQSTMKVTLSRDASSDAYSRCRYFLHDNNGRIQAVSGVLYSVNNDERIENYYYDIQPGVYELVVDGFFLAAATSNYNLSVEFLSVKRVDSGELSSSDRRMEFVNYFNEPKTYMISAEILGYQQIHNFTVDGSSTYKIPFTITKGEGIKEFSFDMLKEDFGKVTDFSMQILDETGKALRKDALSYKSGGELSISLSPGNDSADYTLELIPAFVHKELSMNVKVTETTYLPSGQSVSAEHNGRGAVTLFPNMPEYIDLDFSKPETIIPEDAEVFGKLYFRFPSKETVEYEERVVFKF